MGEGGGERGDLLFSYLWIITAKGHRLKSAVGGGTRGSTHGDQVYVSRCSLPGESCGQLSILLATMCKNTDEILPTRNAPQSLGAQSLQWVSVM